MEENENYDNSNEDYYDLRILYGSQTQTAKFASEELARELEKYRYHTKLSALDDYNFLNLPEENFFIFIVSTTGHGEPPSNMENFWQFILKKDLPQDSLENLNFALFGLGDSTYEKFNWVAKILFNRLKSLSANAIHALGLGDDQHDFGYEGEFDPWSLSLIKTLNTDYFPEKSLSQQDNIYVPKYNVEILNENKIYDKAYLINTGYLKNVNQLTSYDAVKKVFQIDIISNKEIKYKPGDIALIYAENDNESVELILKLMNLNGDERIVLKKNQSYRKETKDELYEITEITSHLLFKKFLNINGIPNRYFCKICSDYTNNELHKEKLLLFASKTSEGKDEFYRYCIKEKRTYVEFLNDFKSVKLPLNILISLIGRINSREYSISSSNLIHTDSVIIF